MSNSELQSYIVKLNDGLLLAEKRMLQEKALHDETIVVMGEDNTIKYIPAKEVIAEHAEFQ
ncbi:MAG: ribosome recycling factor [Prevotella sp.]|nr:ribosome recycling factor [Prevotella sp.]